MCMLKLYLSASGDELSSRRLEFDCHRDPYESVMTFGRAMVLRKISPFVALTVVQSSSGKNNF